MKILVFDNYDSFTYNLVQLIREIAPMASLEVHRNNEIALEDIKALIKYYYHLVQVYLLSLAYYYLLSKNTRLANLFLVYA